MEDATLQLSHYDTIASMIFVGCITIISIVASLLVIYRGTIQSSIFPSVFAVLIILLDIGAILALSSILISNKAFLARKRLLNITAALTVLIGVTGLSVAFLSVLDLNVIAYVLLVVVYLLLITFTIKKSGLVEALRMILKDARKNTVER
jgi:hypothetical protein